MPDGFAQGFVDGSVPPLVAPPRWFRGAEGVRRAWPCEGPFARTPVRGTAAQKAGLRFEKKAKNLLKELLPAVQLGPWFQFDTPRGLRFCQPDALLLDDRRLVVFEMKIRFTSDAYWQLEHLYKPVLEKVYGRPVTARVVVCKFFDPAVPFPLPVRHMRETTDFGDEIGVLQWRL